MNILTLIDVPDANHYKSKKDPKITLQFKDEKIEITYNRSNKNPITADLISSGSSIKCDIAEVRNKYFGYIFQDPYLHPNFNVKDNINTPLFINQHKIEKGKFDEIIKNIGLGNHIDKYIEEVSGGERQRVAILRGLIMKNPIIVGDELTNNIDYEKTFQVLSLIKKRVAGGFNTFLWVTHDIHLIKEFADKIITIKDGNLSITQNPADTEKILALLEKDKKNINELSEPDYNTQKIENNSEIQRYFLSYAVNDLFKSFKSKISDRPLRRPTIDFLITFVSITFVLLFLLSIIKMGYATKEFLSIRLSDPRINNLSIERARGMADQQFNEENIKEIKDKVGEDILKYATPVYAENISFQKYGGEENELVGLDRAYTFQADDPILNDIIKKELGEKDMPIFINSKVKEQSKGVIAHKRNFIATYKYPEDTKEVKIRVNNSYETIPLFLTDAPLPFDSLFMIREEFYLEAYHGTVISQKPSMEFIVVYPKDIHSIPEIIRKVNELKKYEIKSGSNLINTLDIINELESLIGRVSIYSIFFIILLSSAFVTITVYRSINNKRKEIGVFLAYGMKKEFFYKFYLIEAMILSFFTTLASFFVFHLLINIHINNQIINKFGQAVEKIDKKLPILTTTVDKTLLNLSIGWELLLYFVMSMILCGIFFYLIRRIIKQLPVQLMKGNNL